MQLIDYKSRNVGDAMNAWLWPHIFTFDDDPDHGFLGIGSILAKGYGVGFRKVTVFGSGARSKRHLPDFDSAEWDLRFVRGPLSQGLTGAPYISDPAILAPLFHKAPDNRPSGERIGFVPHFKTRPETIAEVEKRFGYHAISPMLDLADFVAELTACSGVVCEAMHGAILADAYRVPWTGARVEVQYVAGYVNQFKWDDFLQSLEITNDVGHFPWAAHLPRKLRHMLMTPDFCQLGAPKFTMSTDVNLERAQSRIMEEAAKLQPKS